FLKGWFKDTLVDAPINRLAMLRLDGDLYESTMDALVPLYGKVSAGGFIIVDDYYSCAPCGRAVDEFRATRGISTPLRKIDEQRGAAGHFPRRGHGNERHGTELEQHCSGERMVRFMQCVDQNAGHEGGVEADERERSERCSRWCNELRADAGGHADPRAERS